jgi:hypothetical protein
MWLRYVDRAIYAERASGATAESLAYDVAKKLDLPKVN